MYVPKVAFYIRSTDVKPALHSFLSMLACVFAGPWSALLSITNQWLCCRPDEQFRYMLSHRIAWYHIVLRYNTSVLIIFNIIAMYHNISQTITFYCIVKRYIAIQYIVLQHIVLYYKVLHSIFLWYISFHPSVPVYIIYIILKYILHVMQFVAHYFKVHCIALFDNISHYITLYHFISHYIEWCSTVWRYTVFAQIILLETSVSYIAAQYTKLQYSSVYCIILDCIELYYIIL